MNEVAEALHNMIACMTAKNIAKIKADPVLLALWQDSSTLFQALCRRQIANGADRAEQEHLIALDETLRAL